MIQLNEPVVLTGGRTDNLLCFYEAEPRDRWRGYLVAPRGWKGRMPLPSPPAGSKRNAAILWYRFQARLLADKNGLAAERKVGIKVPGL